MDAHAVCALTVDRLAALAFDFYRQYGVAVRVARIFNTYVSKQTIRDVQRLRACSLNRARRMY
jgi:hypothetical protein